ncbi:hypothetical protein [Marinobacter nauticus]|uniref:hypothetical protein n=1 Tax=Marinobacter nauticus TaxID=2743 RepID=UPI001C99A228|nr:hypothetical protein [Marinobacter nauticus]MBY5961343.1 hypothetical protein [Marinobacter nauticus]
MFREVLVAALTFLFFYIFVARKMRVIRLAIASFLLFLLSFVRAPMVPVLLGIGASRFSGRFEVLLCFFSSPRWLVFLILSSLLFFGLSYYLGGFVGQYQISYDSYRSSLAPGLAQYIFGSPQIVRPTFKFLSSLGYPFPSFSKWYDFLVSIQIPINLFFYFYFFRGVKVFSLTDFRALSLLAVVFALMFSILTFNPRQYIIVVYLAMPICLVGFVSSFRKSEAVVVMLSIILVFSIFIIYYIYRL